MITKIEPPYIEVFRVNSAYPKSFKVKDPILKERMCGLPAL